jgi:hypothetical protein
MYYQLLVRLNYSSNPLYITLATTVSNSYAVVVVIAVIMMAARDVLAPITMINSII